MQKRLFLFLLCGLLMLAAIGCGQDDQTEETNPTEPTAEEPYTEAYVPNETVSRFLVALKERGDYQNLFIEPGSVPDEYVVALNGCRVHLSPSEAGLGVMIFSNPGQSGQERLFSVFSNVTKAADKSCTQDQLDAALAFVKEQTASSPSFRVCNEVKILSYLPSVKVGGTETEPRLDLVLLNYNESETEE